jgi:hypothetical protein
MPIGTKKSLEKFGKAIDNFDAPMLKREQASALLANKNTVETKDNDNDHERPKLGAAGRHNPLPRR